VAAVASARPYANLQFDPNTTMPISHPSVFLHAGWPYWCATNSLKTLNAKH